MFNCCSKERYTTWGWRRHSC